MKARIWIRNGTALLTLFAATACTGIRAPRADLASGGQVITSDQIGRSGVITAWHAVTRHLNTATFLQADAASPMQMRYRGVTSPVQIYLDGMRVNDHRILATIPASEVHSIQFLSGMDRATRFGTTPGDGVIIVRTRQAEGW